MNEAKKEKLHEIIQKIKSGNETAIEELYTNYQGIVINIAFSIIKNKDISEEISQTVFMKIIKIEKEKLPTTNELSWLYTVTKNQTVEYIRKQHNDLDIENIYDIANTKNEIDGIIDIDAYNKLTQCLEDLEKEIVSLKILSNFTFKEISQILNIPIGTVQWRYYKAVHSLKIFISNLTMFAITFLIYVINKGTKTRFDNAENSAELGDTVEPGDITINDTTTEVQTESFIANVKEASLISISTIFLVVSIVFGIILLKHQQKRKKKTSK